MQRTSMIINGIHNAVTIIKCTERTTRMQSETADLRQRDVVRQVASPYSVSQRFPLCPL